MFDTVSCGRRRLVRCVVGGVLGIAMFLTLSYRDVYDIDLNTGQLREQITLCSIPVATEFQETSFSQMIATTERSSPNWQRVNTFTLWSPTVSPYHRYHATPWILEEFILTCYAYEVSIPERHAHAGRLAEILKTAEPDAVEAYVRQVQDQYD